MRRLLGLLAVLVVLPGCAGGPEADRAHQLLQRADASQAALSSMAYKARMSLAFDGQKFSMDLQGAAVLKGTDAGDQWLRMTMPELPGVPTQGEATMVLRDGVMTLTMLGETQRMTLPAELQSNNQALASLGSLELARCVENVKVAAGKSFHGEPATLVAGVVDTDCVLDVVGGLSGLGNPGGQPFDFDDLGAELGDIRATLFVSDRSHLLVGGALSFELEAQGEKLSIDFSYRLKSVNKPVRFPA